MKRHALLIGLFLFSFINTNAQLLNKIKKTKNQATQVSETLEAGKEVDYISDQAEYLKIKVYKVGQYKNYFEDLGNQVFDDGKKTKFNSPSGRYQRDVEWVGWGNIHNFTVKDKRNSLNY